MGLNAKELSLRLCKMLLASYNTSYTFVQRHPVVSGVFSVFLILYIFLSYIYNFLVYLSPFILVTAIFIRIFWSSEQPQLRYVKREKKRNELKHPRVASKYGRSDFVLDRYYSYSSQYTTSRRRNFRDKKWGLHSGNNEFTNAVSEKNTQNKGVSSLERSKESSSDNRMPAKKSTSPDRQTLRSEPSMSDLVCYGNLEGIRDDKDEESKDDRIKAVEWTENDKKKSTDLGFSEIERIAKMETLIAKRRARKQLKMQIDKGVNPSHLASVFVTRNNSVRPKGFEELDGTEMPDSAPSIIRTSRTFNLLYNRSEEKPIFHQEFTEGHPREKMFSRHASFSLGRFRRFPDKGNHDRLIEQLFSKEDGIFNSDESGLKSPTPQSKCKENDMADMKGEEVENAHSTKSVSVLKNSNNGFAEIDQNISSFQRAGVSEKPESRVHNEAPEKLLKFPISNSTTINESLFTSLASPIEKNQEKMFYAGRQICKTPTYSIASDLQVEVSEVGSPTRAFDGSSSSSDGESSVYDGDNERDITSGSEDMWGNSIHSREVHRVGDFEDTTEANINSNKEILSPFPLQEIDEENSADVSSVSSTCELPGDTPTCAVSYGHNIFCNMKETVMQNETAQPLNSSDVSSSRTNSEKLEEWCDLYENYTNEAEDVRDMNDSATMDKDHTDNKTSNRDRGLSTLQQKSIAEVSVHSNSSFSPRSVLPKKTLTDEVSSSASDQQIHIQVPQSTKMEDMSKTISTGELHPEVMPHNMQPLINDPSAKLHSHNGDFSNFQTNHSDEAKSYIEAKKDFQGNSAHLAEKEVPNLTKPAAGTSSVNAPPGEKISGLVTKDETSLCQPNHTNEANIDMEATKDVQGKSANLAENEVTNLTKPAAGTNSINATNVPSNKEKEVESQTLVKQESAAEPCISAKTMDSRSANNSEGKHGDLKENEAIVSSKSARERNKSSETVHSEGPRQVLQLKNFMPAKQNDCLEEASYLQRKSEELVEHDINKDKQTIGNSTTDSPQSVAAEVTISRSAEVSEGKSDRVNKREAIEQGSNKIEAKISSKSAADSDETISTAHMGEDDKVPKPGKPNDMAQTTSNGELPPEGMPHNMQHLINDPSPTIQAHNRDFSNSQLLSNKENEAEFQTPMKQEPTEEPHINAKIKDSRTANGSEGKHDALNENEAIVSARLLGESQKLSETAHSEEPGQVPQLENVKPSKLDEQNDIWEEATNLQSKAKNLVEDDTKRDKPAIGHDTKDSPRPMVTEVTISRSAEDTEGKSDRVNKREAIEQGSKEIEAKFLSKSAGDSDEFINTASIEGNVKMPKPGKPNDSSEFVEGDMETDVTSKQ